MKAVNYLLPHIQRVPSRIARDELAMEISQKLGIDSAVLRQELKHAATSRVGGGGEGSGGDADDIGRTRADSCAGFGAGDAGGRSREVPRAMARRRSSIPRGRRRFALRRSCCMRGWRRSR